MNECCHIRLNAGTDATGARGAGHIRSRVAPGVTALIGHNHCVSTDSKEMKGTRGQGYTRRVPTRRAGEEPMTAGQEVRLQLWTHWNQRGKRKWSWSNSNCLVSGVVRLDTLWPSWRGGAVQEVGGGAGRATVRRSVPKRRWQGNRAPAQVCFSSGCSVLRHSMETLRAHQQANDVFLK